MRTIIVALVRLNRLYLRFRSWFILNSVSEGFGKNCTVGLGTSFRVTDQGEAFLGQDVCFDKFSNIIVKYGSLTVGDRVYFGIGSVVVARESIVVGDDCLFGEYVSVRDQDHRFGSNACVVDAGFETAPIRIGNNVWVGAKVTITKGVNIGNNVVIGANSVITKDVPSNVLVAGAPARVIRRF